MTIEAELLKLIGTLIYLGYANLICLVILATYTIAGDRK